MFESKLSLIILYEYKRIEGIIHHHSNPYTET